MTQVKAEMKKKGQASGGSRLMKTYDKLNRVVKQGILLQQSTAQIPLAQDTYTSVKPKITLKGRSLKNAEIVHYDGRV